MSMLILVTIRTVRNRSAGYPRFPGPGSSSQGKSGPKARPKGVVDGKQVNIPVPVLWSDAGVEKDNHAGDWLFRSKDVGRSSW